MDDLCCLNLYRLDRRSYCKMAVNLHRHFSLFPQDDSGFAVSTCLLETPARLCPVAGFGFFL